MNKHFCKNKLHSILMIICCAISLVLLAAMYFAKARGIQFGGVLGFAVVLLCPLSHLLLIPLIMGKKGRDKEENKPSCH